MSVLGISSVEWSIGRIARVWGLAMCRSAPKHWYFCMHVVCLLRCGFDCVRANAYAGASAEPSRPVCVCSGAHWTHGCVSRGRNCVVVEIDGGFVPIQYCVSFLCLLLSCVFPRAHVGDHPSCCWFVSLALFHQATLSSRNGGSTSSASLHRTAAQLGGAVAPPVPQALQRVVGVFTVVPTPVGHRPPACRVSWPLT